ncbi:MAG: transposase [Phycisphaerales bacterium JB039]
MKSPLLTIGGTADHVHLLVSLAKTVALADLMMQVKRDSSKLMRETIREFHWQDGYFAFSIGASGLEDVRGYIARQKEHHARVDFKDEVRALLRKYGVAFDERYVWD